MSEQELKLHVPRHARASLERELKQKPVTHVRLHALYFDTPTRALVKAKIALRLRQEGRHWVQTLKMPGDHPLSRIELNHPRPGPVLDLNLYSGTLVEEALSAISEPLEVFYETDVRRILREVRTRQGMVEIAYDTGLLRAGELELPISEIEFELISGKIDAMFTVGSRWQKTHGLIMDARSKSERGDRLAVLAHTLAALKVSDKSEKDEAARAKVIGDFWSPRGTLPVALSADMPASEALAVVTHECLDQIIRNAAILAEVDTAGFFAAGKAEHTHQLRVGIRRLRSAWSLFNGIAPLPPQAMRDEIKTYFSQLGGARDDDVLKDTLLPVLRAAGQPPLILEQSCEASTPKDSVVTSRTFQSWLLDAMASAILKPEPPSEPRPASAQQGGPDNVASQASTASASTVVSEDKIDRLGAESTERVNPLIIRLEAHEPKPLTLKQALTAKLKKWHKQVLRDGLQFEELSIDARHELRKRAKRLRYGLQFAESLMPATRLRHYRKQLAGVQDILGEMNDLAVARERFVVLRDTQPSAWFACGWITSRLEDLTHKAGSAFKQLEKTETFWR